MSGYLDAKIQELENKLNNLRDKLDSCADNNYHEQSRIQMQIGETYKQITDLKRAYSLLHKDTYK